MSRPWRRRSAAAAAALAVTALTLTAARASATTAGAPALSAEAAKAVKAAKTTAAPLKETEKTGDVPGTVLAMLSSATVTGAPLGKGSALHAPKTSSSAINATLSKLKATSIRPVASGAGTTATRELTSSARTATGDSSLNLGGIVTVQVPDGSVNAAVKALAATSGVAFAEPEQYVNTLNTGGTPLTASSTVKLNAADVAAATPGAADLPTNYAFASSEDSYLNAQGDDVGGAFATLQEKYGQLPGTGEIITNVSIGDLTDPTTPGADLSQFGYTTIVKNGQRYLNFPTMPLIPTYVAEPDGTLSGSASVINSGDPLLGEIGLDFSVMAPLPDADQLSGDTASGDYDLLGIAPGASFRLVEPSETTDAGLAEALLAAANQTPRPNVITASLGFGTDTVGYPGRYLEEDPLIESVVSAIVRKYGIVVVISANDGTRLYTPASVGPDGGATPTNVAASPADTTNIDDDEYSTTPGEVLDSGAIDAGGTTTDDTLAVPPGSSADWTNPVYAETRTDGDALFASGFGSRVTLSAPSDNIPSLALLGESSHGGTPGGGTPQGVQVDLEGGTSASAPQIAAAAADVLQAARLTGQTYTPAKVIQVLEQTGSTVATPPQIDQTLNVGKQIDVTAAVDAVLAAGHAEPSKTSIVRLSVAHQQMIYDEQGTFNEGTDPGYLDLSDDGSDPYTNPAVQSGEGLLGPVTFAADITGPRGDSYALVVGKKTFTSTSDYIRVTPTQLLHAAGLPVVSTSDRTSTVTYQVLENGKVLAQTSEPLTLSASDGTYSYAQAPVVQPVVKQGSSVTVSYNLTGDNDVDDPVLDVSTVGRWSPQQEPMASWTAAYSVPLNNLKGKVTIPASAFDDGQGIYGIGIEQDTNLGVFGAFAPVRVSGFSAATRPAAPLVSGSGLPAGHQAAVSRAEPDFTLRWNAGAGATGAIMEISAPGATLYGALNTVDNPNGSQRDDDGVDTGSVVYQALPAAKGDATFNAIKLGLPTSLRYNVRILPTGPGGAVNGQASPTSELTVNDGLVPDNGVVDSFSIAGTDSVAAIDIPDAADPTGEPTAELVHYNPATGLYGPVIATDTAGGTFDVYGVDPAAGTVLAADDTADGAEVGLYSLATNALIASPPLAGYTVEAGRVDSARDRAAVLATDTTTGDDTVIAVSMTTGAVEETVDADVNGITAGTLGRITVDTSNGLVFLGTTPTTTSLATAEPDVSIDLDTGVVTAGQGSTNGDDLLQADDEGGNLVALGYRELGRYALPQATFATIAEDGLTRSPTVILRQGEVFALAVDGERDLAVAMYQFPNGEGNSLGQLTNVNSMGEVDLVDIGATQITGEIDLFDPAAVPGNQNEQSLQLDTATSTGYTFAAGDDQIQSFSY